METPPTPENPPAASPGRSTGSLLVGSLPVEDHAEVEAAAANEETAAPVEAPAAAPDVAEDVVAPVAAPAPAPEVADAAEDAVEEKPVVSEEAAPAAGESQMRDVPLAVDVESQPQKSDPSEFSKVDKSAPAGPSVLESNVVACAVTFVVIVTIAALGSAIAIGVKGSNGGGSRSASAPADGSIEPPTIIVNTADIKYASGKPPAGDNPCEGKKPDLPNVECIVEAMVNVGPQAGANVTKGYKGGLGVDHTPITTPYWQNSMCPVNVHWHLGAEHYSKGQFDENGVGPIRADLVQNLDRRLEAPAEVEAEVDGEGEGEGRQLQVTSQTRMGYQCQYYDAEDEKFTKPYVWKHCVGMEIGETYEVHWPHSAAGACGTPNQYQTPFYDGVFCTDGVLTDTASQIGVQAQVFTVVNDEAYYYGDMFRGMIVDGDFGQDVAMYTGSTTGTSRDNEICSQYSPITWQVDRKCHLISASSFDKMCADMKAMRDDMTDDLYAHGSRQLVADELTANNQANRALLDK